MGTRVEEAATEFGGAAAAGGCCGPAGGVAYRTALNMVSADESAVKQRRGIAAGLL
jgi:hypothetical protein